MAGKVQIEDLTKEKLFNKYNEKLMQQVKFEYIENHFALKTNFDLYETLHSFLLKKAYNNNTCEIIKYGV